MKRLFVLTMLSIVVFTMLCTALVAIARAQPLTPIPLLDEIKDCGGQVCFRGVILGKTDTSDVKPLLANDADMHVELSDNMIEQVKVSTNYGAILFWAQDDLEADRSRIDNMEITFEGHSQTEASEPTFGEIMSRFGSPCKVILAANTGRNIVYPTMTFFVVRLQPSVPINKVISSNDPNACRINNRLEWRWFGWKK